MPSLQPQHHPGGGGRRGGGSPTNSSSNNHSGMLFSSIFGGSSSGSVGSNLRCIFISLSAIYILLMIRLQTQLHQHQTKMDTLMTMTTSSAGGAIGDSKSSTVQLHQTPISSSKSRIKQQLQQFHNQEDTASSSSSLILSSTTNITTTGKVGRTTPAPTPSPTVAVTPKQTFSQDEIKKERGLMEFYDTEIQYFMSLQSKSSQSADSFLWNDGNMVMPLWMKTYLTWHHYQRLTIQDIDGFDDYIEKINVTDISNLTSISSSTNNETLEKLADIQFQKHKYLVMQCIGNVDYRCGGLSDRLRILPYMLRLAYETKRLLLIYWTKPTSLEEFLLPPTGGINWRTPNWLQYRVSFFVCVSREKYVHVCVCAL